MNRRTLGLLSYSLLLVAIFDQSAQGQACRVPQRGVCADTLSDRGTTPKSITPADRGVTLPPVSPGMFVAAPRSGTISAPTSSTRVNGISIIFPELRIGLPSIEIPGLTRQRRDAEMQVDSSRAAYVPNPLYAQALIAREANLRALYKATRGAASEEECGEWPGGSRHEDNIGPAPPLGNGAGNVELRLNQLAQQQAALQRRMDLILSALEQVSRQRQADAQILQNRTPVARAMPPQAGAPYGTQSGNFYWPQSRRGAVTTSFATVVPAVTMVPAARAPAVAPPNATTRFVNPIRPGARSQVPIATVPMPIGSPRPMR